MYSQVLFFMFTSAKLEMDAAYPQGNTVAGVWFNYERIRKMKAMKVRVHFWLGVCADHVKVPKVAVPAPTKWRINYRGLGWHCRSFYSEVVSRSDTQSHDDKECSTV